MSEPCVDMDDRCSDCLEIEADLKAEIVTLHMSLLRYGHHAAECDCLDIDGFAHEDECPCSCGWTELEAKCHGQELLTEDHKGEQATKA